MADMDGERAQLVPSEADLDRPISRSARRAFMALGFGAILAAVVVIAVLSTRGGANSSGNPPSPTEPSQSGTSTTMSPSFSTTPVHCPRYLPELVHRQGNYTACTNGIRHQVTFETLGLGDGLIFNLDQVTNLKAVQCGDIDSTQMVLEFHNAVDSAEWDAKVMVPVLSVLGIPSTGAMGIVLGMAPAALC